MKVDKKERTIRACRQLAAKYREPEGKRFFLNSVCPLCAIHYVGCVGIRWEPAACKGCPLSNRKSKLGCFDFDSCDNARSLAIKWVKDVQNKVEHEDLKHIASAFSIRAAFFDKIIPILEKIPASRFTKKGWRYFEMLDRSW